MLVHLSINTLFSSCTYILKDIGANDFIIVDPGDIESLHDIIDNSQFKGVLLTHGHFDHIYGLNELIDHYPDTPIYTNEVGRELLMDDKKNLSYYHETPYVFEHPECIRIVDEGDVIALDENITAQVFATPGHNDSCLTFVINKAVFTGDAYIPGIKVVTNLPGGKKAVAKQSVERIIKFAKSKTIYPGHYVNSTAS